MSDLPTRAPSGGDRTRTGRLKQAARYAVTAAFLVAIVHYVDLRAVWGTLATARPAYLLIALCIALGDRFLMIVKWQPLLHAQVPHVPIAQTTRAYFAASFAGTFLPASIGGDLLRAIAVGRERGAIVEVGASIAVERLLGLAGAAVFTLIALVTALKTSVDLRFVLPWALVALVGSGMIMVLVWSETATGSVKKLLGRLPERFGLGAIERLASGLAAYRAHGRTVLLVGLLTLIEQAFPIFIIWSVATGMAGGVTLGMLIVAVPLTMFMARLPVAINGLGLLEGSLIYLLGLYGVDPAMALSIAVGWRATVIVASLPGVFFWQDLAGTRSVESQA